MMHSDLKRLGSPVVLACLGVATALTVVSCSTSRPLDARGDFDRAPASNDGNGEFFKEYNRAIVGGDKLEGLLGDELLGRINEKAPDPLKMRLQVVFKWLRQKPIQTFAELRAQAPVFTFDTIPIKNSAHPNVATVIVSQRKDVLEILNQPKLFSVRNYTYKMETSVGPFMLAYDDTPYNNIEKPWMRKMLRPDDLPRIREMVKGLAQRVIRENAYVGSRPDGTPYGRLELVNQVARRVPILFTGKYFGFPGPSYEKMAEWSRATQDDFFHNVKNVAEVHDRAAKAAHEMHEYLQALLVEKRKALAGTSKRARLARDDVFSRMLADGHPELFTDDRIRTNVIGTLVGGIETTQAAIVQSLKQLMDRPAQFEGARRAALAGDDALLAKYVWEALRFDPVNPFVIRYAEQDYALHGSLIKKGSVVLVATHSAMFDPEGVPDPMQFRLDRPDDVYFHLGYGMHRCLGDYVSLVQVPEIVKQILLLPGVRAATGLDGTIQKTPETRSFPESFVVEFEPRGMTSAGPAQGMDPAFAFEEYLQDYNRHEFRVCMSGDGYSAIPKNIWRHNNVNFRTSLFWCRLKPAVRECIEQAADQRKFDILKSTRAHFEAAKACGKTAGRGNEMTEAEFAFYKQVMLGQSIDLAKVPRDQAKNTSGWDFEDHLKFYDRFTYRECFMNPKAISSFPDDQDMIFYARLPVDFRMCMGFSVTANQISGGKLGMDRATRYQYCKNGILNEKTGAIDGALSMDERYYYRKVVLKQNVTYGQVVAEESQK